MELPESEDRYRHVHEWRDRPDFTSREKLAIEFAERFALEHHRIDDELFTRMKADFSDAEILDLMVCVASFLGLGRLTEVLDVLPDTPLVI